MLDLARIFNLFERLVHAVELLAEALPHIGQLPTPQLSDETEVDWRVVRDELDLTASSASVINRKIGTDVPEPTGTPGPRGQYRWTLGDIRRFKRERYQARLAGRVSGASTRSER